MPWTVIREKPGEIIATWIDGKTYRVDFDIQQDELRHITGHTVLAELTDDEYGDALDEWWSALTPDCDAVIGETNE